MPSMLHEILLDLFRSQTELAPRLLREVFDAPLPTYTEVTTEESTLTQLVPSEYRADLVLMLRAGKPVYGIVLEAQLQRDNEKLLTWPLYAAALRAKFKCPVDVLVVTPSQPVADWAAQPIRLGYSDSVYRPYVLGPEGIPKVRDSETALRRPHLAILSALAHGNVEGGIGAISVAIGALKGLDLPNGDIYTDHLLACLDDAAREELEGMLQRENYEWQSDFAKRYVRQGREEGRQEGQIQALAKAILDVLDARNVSLSDPTRNTILNCTDLQRLKDWFERALRAETEDDILQG